VSRRLRLSLFAAGVVLFVAISFVLARFLLTENAERDAIFSLLQTQARGDARGMLTRLDGCARSPACRATVVADASRLRRAGDLKILLTTSHTAYSLTSATGLTRVAWKVPSRLPVVQCVLVRRQGDFLTGLSVSLLALSAPIPGTSTC
jgi:hypothetical protein